MIDVRHIIKVNKLVILTGLFFMSYLNAFNQNQILDSLQASRELKLHTNWGLIIPNSIKQVFSYDDKLKSISNFENGRLIYYYEINKNKGLFNKFYEIETFYSYDSLLRLVCVNTINSNSDEKDSIHYDKYGRIDFYESSHSCDNKKHNNLYTFTYKIRNVFDKTYELIDTTYSRDTIKLNFNNEVLNSDSVSIKVSNDSLTYSAFGKQWNYSSVIKKKEILFVNNKIQIEKSFHKGMYKIDSTQTSYFYENDKLSVVKTDNSRFLNYHMLYYGLNGYLEREVFVFSSHYKTTTNFYNHSYYNKLMYKKEDLKSLF